MSKLKKQTKNIAWVVLKQRTLEDLLLIKLKNFLKKKTEPLTTALSFYPRLKHSTKVSERHAMLICEKIPGGNFGKMFWKGRVEYGAHSLHDYWNHYWGCLRTTGIPKECRWFAAG